MLPLSKKRRMADDQKEEDKKFKNIQFLNRENVYNIETKYDVSSNTITIQIVNQRTKSMFFQEFTDEDITTMTARCYLRPSNLIQMINGNLSSKDLVTKLMRFAEFDKISKAQELSDKCAKMDQIPTDLKQIPKAQHISQNKNNTQSSTLGDDTDSKKSGCALLLMHFEAPPYIFCNYCFVLKEKEIFEIDKLGLRVNDLNDIIMDLQKTILKQNKVINKLASKLNSYEEENKQQQIELTMTTNWKQDKPYTHFTDTIKAYKMGRMVNIHGGYVSLRQGVSFTTSDRNSIDYIELQTIAILPKGWRPVTEVLVPVQYRQTKNYSLVIDTNGRIHLNQRINSVCLDNISFVCDIFVK